MLDNNNNEIWVFLSHSNRDYEKVRRVRDMLEDRSFRPLMFFLKCLNEEGEIDSLIKREIDCRTRFIYCKSENSESSHWVQREVEYIRSQNRIFETIDMDLPESEIKKKLESFRKKANIFISYSHDDVELAKAIYKRLRKYEFNVWIDYSEILSGDNYADRIKNALLNAVNNGYVIALLNERIFNPHSWTKVELSIALQQEEHPERSIIPVVQDHSILERLERDSALALLSTVQAIDSSNIELNQRSDFIVDAIIRRLLPPGAILSHAQNFMNGGYGFTDVEESKRMYQLFFRLAEDSENPAALFALGKCYEYGNGTKVDLNMAYNYYCECRNELGGKHIIGGYSLDEHCQRVYDEMHKNSYI